MRSFLGRAMGVLIVAAIPAVAYANIGPPSTGGQVVAEPMGVVDVAIDRETLTLDLRPLADNGRVRVEAIYHLHNHGAEKQLELVFAMGAPNVADFQVRFAGRPLASAPVAGMTLPASWRTPAKTPGLEDSPALGYLEYDSHPIAPVGFTLRVPPGRHTLQVQYTAGAAIHLHGHPTVYRQFAYVLAPARAWSAFGGLDVTVHLPRNWRAACTPALHRDDDTLTGAFSELPADAIALTVQAPAGWAYQPFAYASLGFLSLTVIGGSVLCWKGGQSQGRRLAQPAEHPRSRLDRHAWPKSLAMAIGWGLAVLAAGLLATLGPEWLLPRGQASH